jgi:mRNA interferase MazF
VSRVYPFQVALPVAATGLDLDSKAHAEQIRSIAVERVGARIGALPLALLRELEDAIRLHLGL